MKYEMKRKRSAMRNRIFQAHVLNWAWVQVHGPAMDHLSLYKKKKTKKRERQREEPID